MSCCKKHKVDKMDTAEEEKYKPTQADKKLIEKIWVFLVSIMGKHGHINRAWQDVIRHFEMFNNCSVIEPNDENSNNSFNRATMDCMILKLRIMSEKTDDVVFKHVVSVFIIKYYSFAIL